MLYVKCHLRSIMEDDAQLPPFKGSTFRGVFGLALKQVVCALKLRECKDCLLRQRCVYSLVFETLTDSEPSDAAAARPSPPHPFVIEPPLSQETFVPAGAAFDFGLILFGWANDYLPYFVYAFEQMGRVGIGRRINGRHSRFQLLAITSGQKEIYNASERRLLSITPVDLSAGESGPEDKQISEITVTLQTPLRLKHRNQLQAELPFHILIRAALRRIASLNNHYGRGEPDLDYRGLVSRAQDIRTGSSTTHWFDWERYSNRQERAMLMGGMAGEASYRGNLAEFMPLLRFGEKVHLGKATTFGLGKIKISQPV